MLILFWVLEYEVFFFRRDSVVKWSGIRLEGLGPNVILLFLWTRNFLAAFAFPTEDLLLGVTRPTDRLASPKGEGVEVLGCNTELL